MKLNVIVMYDLLDFDLGSLDFIVMVQKGSGNFEIVEGGAAIVTGRIYVPENINKEIVELEAPEDETDPSLVDLSGKDFYKELRLRGYNYKGLFRSVTKANNQGNTLLDSHLSSYFSISLINNFFKLKVL